MSGTSGGAVCALLAWHALCEDDPTSVAQRLDEYRDDNFATTPLEQLVNAATMTAGGVQRFVVTPAIGPYENVFAAPRRWDAEQMLGFIWSDDLARRAGERCQ